MPAHPHPRGLPSPAAAWLLGFCLVANLYLLPGRADSPRLTDALGLALWVWVLWRLMGGGLPGRPLLAAGTVALLPAAWGLYALGAGLAATFVLSARWILAVPYAVALLMLPDRERWRRPLMWGLWWGLVLNVAVLAVQYAGLRARTMALGLAASDSELVWGTTLLDRNPGLHGHANASAAVISLLVPVALVMYLRRRAGPWVPPLSFLLVLLTTHITATRSPLLVSLVTVAVVVLASRHAVRTLLAFGLVLAAAVPFWLWLGMPGGRIRWSDTAHMTANLNERLLSNLVAVELSVGRPLGRGLSAGAEAIGDRLGVPAAHDAFLHMAVVYGPLLGLLLAVLLGLLALRSLRGAEAPHALEALLALQTWGLFLFEEHLRNPTFVILAVWLGASALHGLRLPGPAPAAAPRPGVPPSPAAAVGPVGGRDAP